MTNLPCELLDHIVDLLHDSQTPLKNCCLVSKSWVARTRRHLFAAVLFRTGGRLASWEETFPDPSISPACYTKVLIIRCPYVVTDVDAETDVGRLIGTFSGVERLELGGGDLHARGWERTFSLFHAFSPVVKSLRANFSSFPFQHFSRLALTFPLLEDLTMINCHDVAQIYRDVSGGSSTVVQSPSLPTFAGSLELLLRGGMRHTVDWLLSLPNGIHFRKLTLSFFREEDVSWTTELVERCSRTLEFLDVTCNLLGTFTERLGLHR